MLDQNQLDEALINNEIERLEIIFIKENYNDKQKLWFINSKLEKAKISNDRLLIEVCSRLLDRINK